MQRTRAEAFAVEIPAAIADAAGEGLLVWDLAAERSGIEHKVAVIHTEDLVLLIAEQWVVEPVGSGKWGVRPWEGEQDPRFDEYEDLMGPG